jgi:hypothetical protein
VHHAGAADRRRAAPRRDAARSRAAILDAAAALFAGRGYGDTSLQKVADRAGVARDAELLLRLEGAALRGDAGARSRTPGR